jgi:tetratricopeptide (TPR) repeat protein
MTPRQQAETLNQKGLAFQEQGRFKNAAACYREAVEVDPTFSSGFYNLGLLYKWQANWEKSLRFNRQAAKLDASNEAAWWNLGIAATALGRWQTARAAWRGFGIKVPDGRGPVDLPCGFGPVRIHPKGNAEVVWAHRLDPARAEIASIPFPESRHRWCDIVLNDGQPNGYRRYRGQEVPVFDVLELLRPSRFGTYVAHVALSDATATSSLAEVAAAQKGAAEDWTTSTRILCKACSAGKPHKTHDTKAAPPAGVHVVGIAARNRGHAVKILRAWEEKTPFVEVQSLDVGLKPRRPKA